MFLKCNCLNILRKWNHHHISHENKSILFRSASINQRGEKERREKLARSERLIRQRKKHKNPLVETKKYVSLKEVSQLTGRHIDLVKQAASEITRRNVEQLFPKFMLVEQGSISSVFKKLGFRRKIVANVEDNAKEEMEFELLRLTTPSEKHQKNPKLTPRNGIITMLGHIDHGKTSLLDYLRQTSVAASESGGITQSIAAFSYANESGENFTFVDVPGHAAFTSMRMRGARLTDVVVLVVASDDGVMEQTVESIKMINKAQVPVVVAVNKCDLKSSNPKRTLYELAEHDVICEPLGGSVQCENVSAKTGQGVDSLMEKVMMEIEMLDLRCDEKHPVDGVVVETRVNNHLGLITTCIVKHGTLQKGQFLVSGTNWAKVKVLFDENMKQMKTMKPGKVVHISGWKNTANGQVDCGQPIIQVENEATAKKIVDLRQKLKNLGKVELEALHITESREHSKKIFDNVRSQKMNRKRMSYEVLNELNQHLQDKSKCEHNIFVKADTVGSLEVIDSLLHSYDNSKHDVKLNVLTSEIGDLTSSELERAVVSNASIYLFNLEANAKTKTACDECGVKIHTFAVIYHLFDHLKQTLTQLLPEPQEFVSKGEADIQEMFVIDTKQGKVAVAGSSVTWGTMCSASQYQLLRHGDVIDEGTISSIKQGKVEIEEIKSGNECGFSLTSANDVISQEGDVIVCGETVKSEKSLDWSPRGF